MHYGKSIINQNNIPDALVYLIGSLSRACLWFRIQSVFLLPQVTPHPGQGIFSHTP